MSRQRAKVIQRKIVLAVDYASEIERWCFLCSNAGNWEGVEAEKRENERQKRKGGHERRRRKEKLNVQRPQFNDVIGYCSNIKFNIRYLHYNRWIPLCLHQSILVSIGLPSHRYRIFSATLLGHFLSNTKNGCIYVTKQLHPLTTSRSACLIDIPPCGGILW